MSPVEPREAQAPLILVLDAGSSSLRVALYDASARPVAGCNVRERLQLTTGQDGTVELSPEQFAGRFAALIDAVLQMAGPLGASIGAVGMAAFAATVLGVDAEGRPVTPAYLYSDTRPAEQVRQLRREVDEPAVHQRTGCRLHTSYLPARLRWLRDVAPERFRAARRWLSLPDYLYLRLFGATRSSLSLASWTGLLNRHTLAWDGLWLEHLGLHLDYLPAISDAPRSGLTEEWARRWPPLAALPWFPAWGDGAASNIGSGCAEPSRAALNIGTSAALRIVTVNPPDELPSGLWCYRVDARRALVGGALSVGGGAVAWARRTLHIGDMDQAEEHIARARPDGHGLTVLPFLAGERSPGWNPELRFTLTGASLATTPLDILQAVMESIAYRLALVARELACVAPDIREWIAGGGGAVGAPVWLQIIADALGQPVALLAEAEATGRGVALLVLEALGLSPGKAPLDASAVFEPRPAYSDIYRAAMIRQQGLYARLAEWHAQEDSGTP